MQTVKATIEKILLNSSVQRGLNFLKDDAKNALVEQKEICLIPAPFQKETERAKDYLKRLSTLGLDEVSMDEVGNVLGIRKGTLGKPRILVAAHLDTVFPDDTDIALTEKDGKIYAPGIADNSRGLAALLTVARALKVMGLKNIGDIIFCGDVGEEGLGDLRGMKHIFKKHKDDIDACIMVDGTQMGPTGIVYLAPGRLRYEVEFSGRGGHAWYAFRLPSAIHAMGRAIGLIADIQVPKEPKTTFNVGVVRGGTSVNSIASEAALLMDLGSNDPEELTVLESKFLESIAQSVNQENARWGYDDNNKDAIATDVRIVGNRPGGIQSPDSVIVQIACAVTEAIGLEPELRDPVSTDANIPISLKIPAVNISGGGMAGDTHSLGEWFDPTDAYFGPQRILLAILASAGVEGLCDPLFD